MRTARFVAERVLPLLRVDVGGVSDVRALVGVLTAGAVTVPGVDCPAPSGGGESEPELKKPFAPFGAPGESSFLL